MAWVKLIVDLAAIVGWARIVIGLAVRPARRWRRGWTSKLAVIFLAATTISIWSGWFIPWGTVLVWWGVQRTGSDDYELPMADGRPMR